MIEDGSAVDIADRIETARHAIDAGAAVCLLGAGFSVGATDASGKPIPTASELTDELKNLFGIFTFPNFGSTSSSLPPQEHS